MSSSPDEKQSLSVFGIVWRGVLMGIAEVVPGISGGTIAFVTGVYRNLVEGLASFGVASIPMLRSFRKFWQHHHFGFLVPLGIGMLGGVVAFAQLMSFLLANYQPAVWSFFSGLIIVSVVRMGRVQERRTLLKYAPLGLLAGLGLLLVPAVQADPGYLTIFLGGAIAVCAWLLPAVSGSFILLTLGLYSAVIAAISALQIDVILALGSGCAVGILLFAKFLAWLLVRAQMAVFSFFTGFMAGALTKLWPWQSSVGELLMPSQYTVQVGASSMLVLSLLAFLAGAAAMVLLARLTASDEAVTATNDAA